MLYLMETVYELYKGDCYLGSGLVIYGGVIGGIIAAIIFQNAATSLSGLLIWLYSSLIFGQVIGRWEL